MTDEHRSTLVDLGRAALTAIPPSLIVLAVIVGVLLWHEAQQDKLRSEVVGKLIERCFDGAKP